MFIIILFAKINPICRPSKVQCTFTFEVDILVTTDGFDKTGDDDGGVGNDIFNLDGVHESLVFFSMHLCLLMASTCFGSSLYEKEQNKKDFETLHIHMQI